MKAFAAALLCASLFVPRLVSAQAAPPPPGAPSEAPAAADNREAGAAALMAALHPQSGTITLPGGIATLDLDYNFRYLAPTDAKKILETAWGNPPGSADGILGMLIPVEPGPLSEGGWGVVIQYSDDGHVSDKDADKIDFGGVLEDMKKSVENENEERVKQGYEAATLVGWAEPPHYDPKDHKIYWAKDFAFGKGGNDTLNYFIRVLGRKGVLELNAVAGMDQLQQIREAMKKVVGFAEFTKGNRYADFDSGTDKVAAYGLAALVAGGIAAKTGLFAKGLAMLFALKKFVILGLAAIAGLFSRIFKKKT